MAPAAQQPVRRYAARVSEARFTPKDVLAPLGLLGGLDGTMNVHLFNLIDRPDFHYNVGVKITDLYLLLNLNRENLSFNPIG